jgi:hypothetical protein
MKIQLHEYMEFVRSFADQANIMTKSFYIVVPYAPHHAAASAASIFGRGTSSTKKAEAATSFEQDHIQLQQRLSLVSEALSGTGVRTIPLGTEEIIELLYRSFNPGELENPIRLDNK